jgi:hypothetical protein
MVSVASGLVLADEGMVRSWVPLKRTERARFRSRHVFVGSPLPQESLLGLFRAVASVAGWALRQRRKGVNLNHPS